MCIRDSAGSDEKFLSSLIKLCPDKVVYISCNPETLARDLEYLTKKGYGVKRVQPVDMFSFTVHVETVVMPVSYTHLGRGNVDFELLPAQGML